MILVTTFNKKGYEEYGKRMIETFDSEVSLLIFTEDLDNLDLPLGISKLDLLRTNPEITHFKDRVIHIYEKPQDYMQDAVRFCHKVFAMTYAGLYTYRYTDKLFYMDGDTVFHKRLTEDFLNSILPDDCYACYLGRGKAPYYTETGFLGFNCQHPDHTEFMNGMREAYTKGWIWDLDNRTDCHVFDKIRKEFEGKGQKNKNLGDKKGGHVFVRSVLNEYLDHTKGERKHLGYSPERKKTEPE